MSAASGGSTITAGGLGGLGERVNVKAVFVTILIIFSRLRSGFISLPPGLIEFMSPKDILLFLALRLLHARACRALYTFQVRVLWRRFKGSFLQLVKEEPRPYEDSLLGFIEPKLGVLSKLLGVSYMSNLLVRALVEGGGWFRLRPDIGHLFANLMYIVYGAHCLNEVKKAYVMPSWLPASIQDDKRRSYILDRSTSVVLWVLAIFACIECVSAFLRVPVSSTLAFGGIGGLAFGLASKDVVSNFFGATHPHR